MKKSRTTTLFFFLLFTESPIASLHILDQTVAVVNKEVILKSDVENALVMLYGNKKVNQRLFNRDILRYQILDQLIIDRILLQLAQQENIVISNEEVDQAINNIAVKNYMTINQLRSQLACSNISDDVYRARIYKEILIAKVYDNEMRRRIKILPKEVELLAQKITDQAIDVANFEYNLNHILIPLSNNPTKDQLNKAKIIAYSLIKENKDDVNFNKLITDYLVSSKIIKGNLIGWKKIEDIPLLFVEQLLHAKKGKIIGPLFFKNGFHILKVNDVRYGNGGKKSSIITEEVHIRHILMHTSTFLSDYQIQTKLENIASQIKNGSTNFSSAARKFSEDIDSVNRGGDLGWNLIDMLDPVFRVALTHLKKGEISTPIRSSVGWHLVELVEKRQINIFNDFQKKHYAFELLFSQKFAEEEKAWLQEQRAINYIKIFHSNEW
ncbi:peptidylprolyl isomerase SurA [Sodalis sp. CWE]|uniref:peptidylprolyl isomerase SurA n=1 Tax=Sodalis sp. CWE TaxID=2803816 RepID=UPI001C7CE6B0|nr:peptidylprolyl isomerase SurA [Sodalis sp. CWE]MBX4180730.1 peptidylprolyl isomerase SurA [Sodalis sp. CWE]